MVVFNNHLPDLLQLSRVHEIAKQLVFGSLDVHLEQIDRPVDIAGELSAWYYDLFSSTPGLVGVYRELNRTVFGLKAKTLRYPPSTVRRYGPPHARDDSILHFGRVPVEWWDLAQTL